MDNVRAVAAFFEHADQIKQAAREARLHRFRRFDALTPFPVHGLDEAMGLRRSKIPWVTLALGLTGATLGFAFQAWTSAIDWPINVGGKPFVSWPAFVPVTFECMVLMGGLATAAALFHVCRLLPKPFFKALDPAITRDRFVLVIPTDEVGFRMPDVEEFLKRAGAYEIRMVTS